MIFPNNPFPLFGSESLSPEATYKPSPSQRPSYRTTFQEFWHPSLGWSAQAESLPSLEHPQPLCPLCTGTSPLTHGLNPLRRSLSKTFAQAADLTGLLAFLPQKHLIPSDTVCSLNETGYRHPCLILHTSSCGHMVYCIQVTAFSDAGTLREKYPKPSEKTQAGIFWQYASIKHSRAKGKPTNTLPTISTSVETEKPSYLNLSSGFWIEWEYLLSFLNNACKLDQVSLDHARKAHAVVLTHHERHGNPTLERLANAARRRSASPSASASPSPPPSLPQPMASWGCEYWQQPAVYTIGELTPPASRTPSPPAGLNAQAMSFSPSGLSAQAMSFTPNAAWQQPGLGMEMYVSPPWW